MLSSPLRDPCGNTEQYMAEFDSDYTARFYDVYGDIEWERLEATPYGRLQATIHADFIKRYVRPGARVLDAGCGPGRFTAVAAQLGATVTALDISERQLELAKQRVGEAKMLERVDAFVHADISGSNVTTFEGSAALSEVATDPKAWETIVSLERRMNTEPGLVDTGSHIILVTRRER